MGSIERLLQELYWTGESKNWEELMNFNKKKLGQNETKQQDGTEKINFNKGKHRIGMGQDILK